MDTKELYGEGFNKTPFQTLIQLDRYTIKELDTSKLKVGDIIVAVVDDSKPAYPKKDWGKVIGIDGENVTFFGEQTSTEYTVHLRRVYLPIDYKWDDAVDRMVKGIMSVDTSYAEQDPEFANRLYDALYNERIVPGGRVQSSLGALEKYGKELNLTAYNCYVIPSPSDSRKGILDTLTKMTEIMARGGGVGITLSTLRPKYAKVFGVNGTSSGSVSWGGVYSYVTGLIEQGGSRRGALMLQLHITHPDIIDFVTVKTKAGEITNANLSIQITAEFMEAVENDEDWKLMFPDTSHKEYSNWGAKYEDIHDWLNAGLPVEVYQTIKARDLYQTIVESAWKSAEPGFVVYDYMNDGLMTKTQKLIPFSDPRQDRELFIINPKVPEPKATPWNNTYYYQKNTCTNPCGEQPLPAWGICNLVHINLAEFSDGANSVKWEELAQAVHDTIRFADNVIDYTPYHFEENEKVQKEQRRIGLGTMGLADLLINCGLRYGSPESVEFIDTLYNFIKNEAYRASALLAEKRGKFPTYCDKLMKARVPASLSAEVKELIQKHGLRNSHLLTQAPTGTTATKTGRHGYSVGTGIEPYFAIEWTRTSRMGTAKDYLGKAKEWLDAHPGETLPEYFVSAMGTEADGTPQITPDQHVLMQSTIQKHNDSAISKTTNTPNNFTVEDTWKLYQDGFRKGLIGITMYRDGSRDEQVLNTEKAEEVAVVDEKHECKCEGKCQEMKKEFKKRPKRLIGETIKTDTPFGKAYVTINKNFEQEIEEVFIKLGKSGADISAIADGLAIAITGILSPRIANLEPKEKLEWLITKFKGISGANMVGWGKDRVESLPDGIAKVLELSQIVEVEPEKYDTEPAPKKKRKRKNSVDVCPSCGKATFVKGDGCYTCLPDLGGCGHSKCG